LTRWWRYDVNRREGARLRGYFGIGVVQSKTPTNMGTLWRSAHNFGAAFCFTVERRYSMEVSDTTKAQRHIPLFHFTSLDDLLSHVPADCALIGVEQHETSRPLAGFSHPERAIYLLGAEDRGLPEPIIMMCRHVLEISSPMCLNVAVAGSIVMYDRQTKTEV
jgi:tRNA G18 (ribose-2'-O)-methylase SpoU